jgi:uncharacterized protein involved in outer membrane biogenesis
MLKKILLVFASLLTLALLIAFAVFAYLQFADLSRYKPQISQRLSQYLGRPVTLAGDFDIKILPLSISLTDARVANAPWSSTPTMLSVQHLDLQLGLLPLLTGQLLISDFVLDDVQVVVEHNEQGDNNWKLIERKPKKAKTKAGSKSTALPLDFASNVNIDIKNIALSYSQSPGSPKHEFVLNKATIKGISELNALKIDVAGQIDNHGYQVKGKTGALGDLLSKRKFPVDLQAQVLNTHWALKGVVKNILKLERAQLNVKANAEDLAAWQQWLGVNIQHGPVNFSADIDGNIKKLSLTNLMLQVDRASAKGNLILDMEAEKPLVTAKLNLGDIHVEEFIDAIQSKPDISSEAVVQPVNVESKNTELDLSFLKLFDSSVVLSAAAVGYREWMVDQFDATASVKDGRVSVAPFSIKSKLGEANGQLSLSSEQGLNIARLEIDAKELALDQFPKMQSTLKGIGALQGSMHTEGRSWMDLYANLQGNATAHYANKEQQLDTKIVLRRSNPETSAIPFDVAIDGKWQKVPYKITGEIGGPMALIDDKPYPASAHLTILDADAKVKGTIANLFKARGFNIDINARAQDLTKFNKNTGLGLPDLKNTQVHAVFSGDYPLLKFNNIKAKSNSVSVSGNVQVGLGEPLPNITGDITVNKFDLAAIRQQLAKVNKIKSREGTKSGNSETSALEKTISFAALQNFNMNISLKASASNQINIPHFPVTNFHTQISVANSMLSVSPLNIKSPMGEISADFKVNAQDKVSVVEANLNSSNLDLEKFEFNHEDQPWLQAVAAADVTLQAQGNTLQQWLESVTGSATLNYQQTQKPRTFAIRLARETLPNRHAAPITVRVNSKLNETILQGDGSVSAPHTWLSGGEPAKLDFSANAKGFVAKVQGKIDDLITGEGLDVRVAFNNEQALTTSFDQNDLISRIGKVRLNSEIKGNYSNIVASQLDGFIGEGRISGSTKVNFRERPVAVEFDLNIDGLDISQWATEDTKPEVRKTKKDKIFSPEKLPFKLLKGVAIKGTVNGDNIQFRRVKAQDFNASINLNDGTLQFVIDRLETSDGLLNADLNVDANAEPPRVSLKMDVPKINLYEFARNTAAEGLIKGEFSADVSLSSVGNSIAELAAGLDGHVRFLVGKGTIDSALLNVYVGGLSAMVGMLTAANVKTTKVNCGICGLKFTKGKGVAEVVLLDTQNSTLVAEGWVDLANETLNVKASPVKKGLRLNTELPVVVQGKLSDPKVSTQPTSALNTAAEIATVWFIPTTAIFIGYDALRSGDKNPCVNMMAPTKESAGLRALKGAGKAVGDIGSVFSKGLSALLGGASTPEPQEENAPE